MIARKERNDILNVEPDVTTQSQETFMSYLVILLADGVATRKRNVAPKVSNQEWPGLVGKIQHRLLGVWARLQVAEQVINTPHSLYSKDLAAEYQAAINQATKAAQQARRDG